MTGIVPIVMPKWGLEMRAGTVQDWLVQEGARIEPGQALVDVETDKIANAVEASDAGLLRRIVARSGDTLPVKALLGVLAEATTSEAEIDAYIAAFDVPAVDADDDAESGSAFGYVVADGIRVRYVRRGARQDEQDVPVLFVHGFGGDLNNWLFNLDALARQHPVLALDLPAHGQSDAKLPGASIAALAGFVLKFLDTVNVSGPVHLVGHSMGGAIALYLACHAPARVASLALVSPAGFDVAIDAGYVEGFVNAQSRRELKPVLARLFADPALVSRQMIDDLLRFKRMDGIGALLAELGAALFRNGAQTTVLVDQLPASGKPMLVLWGKDDRVIPASQAARAPPDARVILFDATGHMAMLEQASEVNAALLRHLRG